MELILFFSGICALAILVFIFDWRWIERRRKDDDPELSSGMPPSGNGPKEVTQHDHWRT